MFTTPSEAAGAARRLVYRRMFDHRTTFLDDGVPTLRSRRDISGVALGQRNCNRPIAPCADRLTSINRQWPTSDRIAPGVAPASRRCKSRSTMRPTPAPAPAVKQTANPSSSRVEANDFTASPHRISASSLNYADYEKIQRERDAERAAHTATKKALGETSDALKKLEARRLEEQQRLNGQLQETQRTSEARIQDADNIAYEKARNDLRQQMEEELAESAQRAQSMRQLEQKAQEHADALQKAQKEAKDASARAARENADYLLAEKAKVIKRAEQEHLTKWKEVMAAQDSTFKDELRRLKEGRDSRSHERADYGAYRSVWRSLDLESGPLENELQSAQEQVDRTVRLWRETERRFNLEKIEAWFPQRYPKIIAGIRRMLGEKLQAAEQSARALERIRASFAEREIDVRSSGHLSRTLTRHSRFEEFPTTAGSIELSMAVLGERSLESERFRLDKQRREIERQKAFETSRRAREQLANKLADLQTNRSAVAAALVALRDFNDAETYMAVSQSSLQEQEVFLKTLEFKELILEIDRNWSVLSREWDFAVQDAQARPTIEGLRRDRAAFQATRRELKRELSNLERSIRQRQLLEESLGKTPSKSDRKEYGRMLEQKRSEKAAAALSRLHAMAGSRPAAPRSPGLPPRATAVRRIASPLRKAADGKTKVETDATRPGNKTRDVTAAKVDAKKGDQKAVKASPRDIIRKKRLKERSKSKTPLGRPQTSTASADSTKKSPPSGPNIQPTKAKQAPHAYWPTYSDDPYAAHPPEDAEMVMTTTDDGVDAYSTNLSPSAEEVVAALPNSQVSGSSYEPSQRSGGGSSASPTSSNGYDEDSKVEVSSHLRHQMSAADHRKAMVASPNTPAAYWTYKLYKDQEGKEPLNYYCTTLEQAEKRASEFLNEPVIGFDIEWEMRHTPGRSGIKKNVSLIQIAADDKIALFHIAVFKGETVDELMPPSLRRILESRDVVKAGVNIQGDAWRMEQCLKVKMTGIFELSHLYRVVMLSETPNQINRRPFKLADQVENVLLLPLKKDAVRTSAWSKKLDWQQSEYAASDAYAGFRLYHALEAKRKLMDPMPPRPAFWEEHKPIQLGDGTLIQAKSRKKAAAPEEPKIAEAEDDDEDEEFFDAMENLDAYNLDAASAKSADVPTAGLSISYPTLPSIEDQLEGLTISGASSDKAPTDSKPPKRTGPPPSDEVDRAEQWVAAWRASRPPEYPIKATQAQLRAYALWHAQGLDCKDVAVLLRETPLSLQTVASYVLEATRQEKLEVEAHRVREVLEILPPSVHRRYARVVEQVGR